MKDEIKIRIAEPSDTKLILSLICELAEYEKMLDQVEANESILHKMLFEEHRAEVLIGQINGVDAGFALFFHNFSTFVGKSGLYLEDIYVRPDLRGKGLGKSFFLYLAKLAKERNCGRMEWCCLDWNKNSIDFYLSMGAKSMNEWTTYRFDKQAIENLIENFK